MFLRRPCLIAHAWQPWWILRYKLNLLNHISALNSIRYCWMRSFSNDSWKHLKQSSYIIAKWSFSIPPVSQEKEIQYCSKRMLDSSQGLRVLILKMFLDWVLYLKRHESINVQFSWLIMYSSGHKSKEHLFWAAGEGLTLQVEHSLQHTTCDDPAKSLPYPLLSGSTGSLRDHSQVTHHWHGLMAAQHALAWPAFSEGRAQAPHT